MKIIIDGMGGDNAPKEVVKGVVETSKLIDHEIIMTGDEAKLRAELKKYKYDENKIKIRPTTEVITNDESPVKAIRRKKDSSMAVGLQMVADGEGDLFISAGSTGALMAGGLFILGRIRGIDRPAIASIYPILGGSTPSLLVDAGANAECKPNNLLEFAIMGSIFCEKVYGIDNPRVGLVNIGTEEEKGSLLTKTAHELIKESKVNFVGNVEARELPKDACDVIVCDGFTGNVILKLTEGLAWHILKYVKAKFTEDLKSKLGAGLLAPKLKSLKGDFDYASYGGAPILGVKGPIIKMHGSSNAAGVQSTILRAIPYVENHVVDIITEAVAEIGEIEISE